MDDFTSGSDSDSYGYDLTVSDEEQLLAVVDRVTAAPVASSPLSRPGPSTPAKVPRHTFPPSSPFSPYPLSPEESQAVDDTIAALSDVDLDFDISELQEDDAFGSGQSDAHQSGIARGSVPKHHGGLAALASKTKPKTVPALFPGPDIVYPDLSRALSVAEKEAQNIPSAVEPVKDSDDEHKSPLLRFRTFPKKPLSVSDLTAGSWCELQYFYTLTRLPGGRKTRTTAMRRGTAVHERLERQLFTPVEVEIAKKEDSFGLKIWNMIQGLRVLRDEGFTREFEVWGIVDGNVVNGVIDSLSFENPDPELQEDVLSSRGSSQTVTESQPYESSAQGRYQIFITDVKTRNSRTPPPQAQVRTAIIQLFLYHRFLSEMASDKLDYIRVFERYGCDVDETFSDAFMAQIGSMHDEVFADTGIPAPEHSNDNQAGYATDTSSNADADFVSAPSSPSQLSHPPDSSSPSSSSSNLMRYRTLRTLLPLLRLEMRLTFPHAAADIGQIVAVEYRHRGRDASPAPPPDSTTTTADIGQIVAVEYRHRGRDASPAPPPDSTTTTAKPPGQDTSSGSVICTNTFFVSPDALDVYLSETMQWWSGARPPRGVSVEEAGLKCRTCEFAESCEWRQGLDQEALRKARAGHRLRQGGVQGQRGSLGAPVVGGDFEVGVDGKVPEAGAQAKGKGALQEEERRQDGEGEEQRPTGASGDGRRRSGRIKAREAAAAVGDVEDIGQVVEEAPRKRGRRRKVDVAAGASG